MVGRPTRRPDRTTAVNSGRRRRRACAGNTSGGELLATLAPATGDDRPTGAGAHPQPEAVGLGPAAGVRLERALAHEVLLLHGIGGRVLAGRRARTGVSPRKLVSPRRRPVGRADPAPDRGAIADSDQHSRGSTDAGSRLLSRHSRLHHRPARRTEARRGNAVVNSLRRAEERPAIVARLWMRLLASPSLRIGSHYPVTAPTRRSDRRSRFPVRSHNRALTSTDIVLQDRSPGPGWTTAGDRAHPVDSD